MSSSEEKHEHKFYVDFDIDGYDGWNPFKHEDISDYHKGGFHPVHLDDRLDGRYRVVHKLGYGGYGVVWLCYDEVEHIWRAVKILSADQSDPEHCQELKILEVFRGCDREKVLRENHLVLPVGAFTIDGPNGHHACIVFPLLGPVLDGFQLYYAPCTELLKDISFQLAQALDFLHSNHLCHGDFRPDNIMFRLADGVDKWPEEKLLEVYDKPQIGRVMVIETDQEAEPSPELPKYIVGRTRSKGFGFDSGVISTSIAVSDLGVSFDPGSPPEHCRIPVSYSTPDALLRMLPPGFANDVWAMMGTILVVRTGNKRPQIEDYIGPESVLSFCEFVDGPMPQNYRVRWKEIGQKFKNDENDLTLPATLEADFYHSRIRRLKEANDGILDYMKEYVGDDEHSTYATQEYWDRLAKEEEYKATGLLPRWTQPGELDNDGIWYTLDADEVAQLTDLCNFVYKWQPEDRASTKQILDHPWFGDRNKRAQDRLASSSLPQAVPEVETTDSEAIERHAFKTSESVSEVEMTQVESYDPQAIEHTTTDESKLVEQPELVSEHTVAADPETPSGTPSWVLKEIKKWWVRCVGGSRRAQRKR